MTVGEDRVLYCDDCYAVRGYGFCEAHRYLWGEPPAIDEIRPQGEMPKTRRLTLYVSRDKNSNWSKAEELWPKGPKEVQRAFAYTLLEAAVEVEIDLESGRARAIAFAGVPLERPTDWGL